MKERSCLEMKKLYITLDIYSFAKDDKVIAKDENF